MKQVCHLIAAICTAFVQLGTHAVAQEQWRHEKLLSQVYDVAATPQYVWINAKGEVAYYASPTRADPSDVWLNRTNLTSWLGPNCINAGPRGISDSGHVVYEAARRDDLGRLALGVYVGQTRWWEQVYGGGQYMELMVTEGGVDDRGIPVYRLREDKPGGNYYLYQGHRLVQDGILSGQTWIGMPKVNASGQLAWHGRGDETGGKSHVFLDDYPLSRSIVGPNYAAAAAYLTRRGEVLWTCPDLNGYTDIFINDVNYSRSHFGNARRNYHAYARGMNDNGDIVWSAIDWNLGYGYPDVFKDHENLSLAVYGDIPRAAFPMGISNTGQAVWIGFREGLEFKNTIWRDTTDISNPVLGPTGTPTDAPQIDNWGRVMWWAYGPQFNGWVRTFVDSLDISADALGDDVWNYTCKGVKIGPNGHVFWIAVDLRTNLADVWLSTPVPEPSGIAGLGLMLVWLASRRSRRV